MKQTYKLTKEEYDELQELLSWWRKKKQKKIDKKIKAGKGINPMIEIVCTSKIAPKEYDFFGNPK
jgi:hypothetical protein